MRETKALDKFLAKHKDHCAYWIFSGDRHCSCGRDEALHELAALLAEVERPLPAANGGEP